MLYMDVKIIKNTVPGKFTLRTEEADIRVYHIPLKWNQRHNHLASLLSSTVYLNARYVLQIHTISVYLAFYVCALLLNTTLVLTVLSLGGWVWDYLWSCCYRNDSTLCILWIVFWITPLSTSSLLKLSISTGSRFWDARYLDEFNTDVLIYISAEEPGEK